MSLMLIRGDADFGRAINTDAGVVCCGPDIEDVLFGVINGFGVWVFNSGANRWGVCCYIVVQYSGAGGGFYGF